MMTFPADCDHVILMGGSPLLVEAAKMLIEKGYVVDIYTAPRQEAEMLPNGKTLGQTLTKSGMDWYIVTDDINQALPLHTITAKTIGIGLGEAWQYQAPLLNAFEGRLLDFMGIPLPRYRGGAHYSWAIMNQEMEWGCCLQEVTLSTLQGECDDGAIVCQQKYNIPGLALTPKDWFGECVQLETTFLSWFFDAIKSGYVFQPAMPNERRSLFFPRLKTAEQGWIDWSWTGSEIADFISAFDAPYAGAHTTMGGDVVQLRGAEFFAGEEFHPFARGLVLRVEKNRTVVATRGGQLHIEKVIGRDVIKPGYRFFTGQERLERAMTYTPVYTSYGEGEKKAESIAGKLVSLRPMTMADANETYVGWLNDPTVRKYMETRDKQTMDGLQSWVRKMTQSQNDLPMAIIETASKRHVGNIKIGSIDWFHKNADIGYLIGDKDVWGKGYATEAIRLATDYAINKLGLYHIRAGVMEENVASIKALRKAGYAFDGIWSGQLFDGQKRTGHAWLSATADAWLGVTT
jgi:RimJ/RimL family protein N-acetyltransferase/methionyl-tRNA formyltransferase